MNSLSKRKKELSDQLPDRFLFFCLIGHKLIAFFLFLRRNYMPVSGLSLFLSFLNVCPHELNGRANEGLQARTTSSWHTFKERRKGSSADRHMAAQGLKEREKRRKSIVDSGSPLIDFSFSLSFKGGPNIPSWPANKKERRRMKTFNLFFSFHSFVFSFLV